MKNKKTIISIMCFLIVFLLSPYLTIHKSINCQACMEEHTANISPTLSILKPDTKTDNTKEIKLNIDFLIQNISKEDLPQEFQIIIDNTVNKMLEDNKHIWEVKEEFEYVVHKNAPKNTRKSYMSYKAITSRTSPQYKLQQIAYTGTHGIRQVNGRFCIALGSAYTKVIGTYVDIILENREVIPCILADQKQDIHTDETHRVCFDGSLVEFVVDTDYVINRVIKSGDLSVVCEEWNPMVEEVIVYDKVEDF